MALWKRSRLRKPQACFLIQWILAFWLSAPALVTRSTTALTMPHSWSRIVRATCFMGSSRLRMAQPTQRFQAFSAQPRVA